MNLVESMKSLSDTASPVLKRVAEKNFEGGKTALKLKAGRVVLDNTFNMAVHKMPFGGMIKDYLQKTKLGNSFVKLLIAQAYMLGMAGVEGSIPADKRKYVDVALSCMAMAAYTDIADNSGIDDLIGSLITPEVKALADES